MAIAVSGSIATDHLMHFPGRFAEHLIADALDRLSLSFLVDALVIHRGGVGANIAFGLGVLGCRPLLIGAAGMDFDEYGAWLEEHGVDCAGVLVVPTEHTGRFTCTTDDDQCQLASFFPGAMEASRRIVLGEVLRTRPFDLVLIGASDPESMVRQTADARALGVAFAADPSQQLPRLNGEQCLALTDGAQFLFTNQYEWELLCERTGWTPEEITRRVGLRITTMSSDGVHLVNASGLDVHVQALPARTIADPTGVGDGFRSGFLAGVEAGLPVVRCTQLGALVATLVIESQGAQTWSLDVTDALERLSATYGPDASDDIGPLLRRVDPIR